MAVNAPNEDQIEPSQSAASTNRRRRNGSQQRSRGRTASQLSGPRGPLGAMTSNGQTQQAAENKDEQTEIFWQEVEKVSLLSSIVRGVHLSGCIRIGLARSLMSFWFRLTVNSMLDPNFSNCMTLFMLSPKILLLRDCNSRPFLYALKVTGTWSLGR